MQATIVDLRYQMNDVLKALDRNEDVEILYRGKKRGTLVSASSKKEKQVVEHAFFNMRPSLKRTVEEEMELLRGGRYNDL